MDYGEAARESENQRIFSQDAGIVAAIKATEAGDGSLDPLVGRLEAAYRDSYQEYNRALEQENHPVADKL